MCICVQLVGTSLSCAFLSIWDLRVLYSRCTHTASCHSSSLMSWTNCSLGCIFSSPDLCGFLHPLQFLVFLNKAHISRLEMGFCCPAPSNGKMRPVLSPVSFKLTSAAPTTILRIQVQSKDSPLGPFKHLQRRCLPEALYTLGLASWKAAWQRKTQGSWGTPSWAWAINMPLSQTGPTGSWLP